MKKQKIKPTPVALRWGLVVVGATLALFALQSIALWLPWSWAYGLASNATVWPLVQLVIVLGVGLIGGAIWYTGMPTAGIVFLAIATICLIPTAQMFIGLRQFSRQHDVRVPVSTAFQMLRSEYPADDDVKYGRGGQTDLHLSVYHPYRGKTLPAVVVERPAVVYVHGGGWSGGSRTENGDFFRWLNDRGYLVLSVDYRYARDDYASWRDAPRDVACALAWLNTHSEDGSVNRNDVAVMGDSAGGQLALRAAYGLKNGDVTSSCGGLPIVPSKVVGIVPAVDFPELYDDPVLGPTSRENVVRYLGGTPSTASKAYEDSSIITHVQPGLQRTLIINAANDTLVSPRSGEALAAKLRDAGVETEQYTLPYAAHSYWINPGGYQNQTARALIEHFLNN